MFGMTGVPLSSTSGLVEDILIIPVNIAYDRIVERDFVKAELMVSGVRVHWIAELHVYVFHSNRVEPKSQKL